MEIQWTYRHYHVQDNADVAHQDVIMYCNKNKYPKLTFCGSYSKPRSIRGLKKNNHFRFGPKLGNGICAISRITCACVACTSMLDQPWISGIHSKKQARYQPVTYCTYWPVLGSYNSWNIIEVTPKSTTYDAFDEINHAVFDRISENMASLVQSSMYGVSNKHDTTTNGLYVIKLLSEAYMLQIITHIDGQVISAGELVVKAQYICYMK